MDSLDISENCRLYSQYSFNCISTNFHCLFILSFNIRSLNENGRRFAPNIDGLNKKPDIIALSDTWFNETNFDNLPGYKAFNSERTKKKQGVNFQFFVEIIYPSKL